ncbi:hypothetical protein CHARACLAT_019800 [Characodon lateralis]|uniref:Rho guanine nucleotide exchange factor 40 n=1 Tax=Characodon lateralis TaxID=208331 RepID=A0ABU7E623_9TELE|nr:hypothetical protein [Characodon lateralis]
MEDCVQGALSSLYPPFESTAPPLLSQVFSVLESTYQHDSLRYLLDYFVPAKHLLHKLQQHACSQYLGCLFLHSGWPLCLGEKVVVQLSTLDWRLLRSNDFYLQVVPFSTRCPRLALKCLAPGGRTVQEILVPESQHPLVFTSEWLHCINKERGHKREVGGGLDTCLVSTCDGVVRLPWKEIVYPKLLHDPSEELGLVSNRLSSEGGGSLGGWGGSSSGDLDSWSWDEEEDDSLLPNSMNSDTAIRRRCSEDGLGRTARQPQMDGDYVELLEPRGGPDGGVDPKQRYLEMHGICKTRTLPFCRRGKAIKLRKGKAWGCAKTERSGSFRGAYSTKEKEVNRKDDLLPTKPPKTVEGTARGRQSYFSSSHDSDEGDKTGRRSNILECRSLYVDGPLKERRPGVGKERDSNGFPQPSRDGHQSKDSQSSDSLVVNEIYDLSSKSGHDVEGQSDHGSHSDSVFEDADKPLSGDSDVVTPTSDAPERLFTRDSESKDTVNIQSKMRKSSKPKIPDGRVEEEAEDRACPRGKEVKTAGFRAPRRKRKGKGGKGRAKSGGKNQKGAKLQGKSPLPSPTAYSASTKLSVPEENQSEETEKADEPDGVPTTVTKGKENTMIGSTVETDDGSLPVCNDQSGPSSLNHSTEEAVSSETCPDQINGVTTKEPALLRDLDAELLQSGKLQLTGTVDRLGRALVFTDAETSQEGICSEEMTRILFCYHHITRSLFFDQSVEELLISNRKAVCAANWLKAHSDSLGSSFHFRPIALMCAETEYLVLIVLVVFRFIRDQVAGAADSAETPRRPSPQTPPPAPPGGAQGFPRPAERHSPSNMSWVVPWASSRWDMPGTPPEECVQEASCIDARAISTGSSRCGGAAALLRAPPGWPSSSPYL